MKNTSYPVPTLPCLRVDEDGDVFLFTKWTKGKWSTLVHSNSYPERVGDIFTAIDILANPHEMKPYNGEVPLSLKPDLKIDDPIWVNDGSAIAWHPRHFSGWREDGWLTTWVGGKTSHTTTDKSAWPKYSLTNPNEV